jgi:hypothetical protein
MKITRVLGLLGLQPNRVVRQEEIIDVLWVRIPRRRRGT